MSDTGILMPSSIDFAAGRIIPFAKTRGVTSFSALNSVKEALRRNPCVPSVENAAAGKAGRVKVGHTGTLDSFADGLLVVLTGKLTRLAPCITALPKRYKALVRFGFRTDTLDPYGMPSGRTGLPCVEKLFSVLPEFTGKILQRPPEYSALKSGGKRLSDLVREGADVQTEPREISVYNLSIEKFFLPDGSAVSPVFYREYCGKPVAAAVLNVFCSKGTYIRALARDIAAAAGSSAFLYALRRLSVGPFSLAKSAGCDSLPRFRDFVTPRLFSDSLFPCDDSLFVNARKHDNSGGDSFYSSCLDFTPRIAGDCGLPPLFLKDGFFPAFCAGKPVSEEWFSPLPPANAVGSLPSGCKRAVFYGDVFAGIVSCADGRFSYDFVAGRP